MWLMSGPNVTTAFSIVNSTISSNQSAFSGGIDVQQGAIAIYNSTIAGNTDSYHNASGAGLYLRIATAALHSSIFSGNFQTGSPPIPDDIGYNVSGSLSGANNIVLASSLMLPPDAIVADAQLGPLAYNGGNTATLTPLASSPAIDNGNNLLGLAYDQRGPGYLRVVGSASDIGAYEVQSDPNDPIFGNGFDP